MYDSCTKNKFTVFFFNFFTVLNWSFSKLNCKQVPTILKPLRDFLWSDKKQTSSFDFCANCWVGGWMHECKKLMEPQLGWHFTFGCPTKASNWSAFSVATVALMESDVWQASIFRFVPWFRSFSPLFVPVERNAVVARKKGFR